MNKMATKTFQSISEYISTFPKVTQTILEDLRQTIKECAPQAIETISYQIPTFKLHNKNLLHFAAYQNHVGFYPTPSGIDAFKEELSPWELSKGSVKFPIAKPIPMELIKRIVKFRVHEVS